MAIIPNGMMVLLIMIFVFLLSFPYNDDMMVMATHRRRSDCYWSIDDQSECHNWGTCQILLSTYNTTLADLSENGAAQAYARSRWHCECHSQRYEANGTSSRAMTKPSCQYALWDVPGISQWSVPWWLGNGVLCASIVAASLATLTRMYRIDKLKRNLTSLALICICVSFLQQSLGQFLLVLFISHNFHCRFRDAYSYYN
jgi:hypothetical protein